MNILFFTHYFPPEVNAPATRTYDHCRRWVRQGHKVTVITCAPNCPDGVVFSGYKNKLFQRETIDGVDVVRTWTFLAANKGFIRRVTNYFSYMLTSLFVSLFLKKPDVIISTSPQFFCGWAGVLCGWIRRRPSILEIRDIWPESIKALNAVDNPGIIRALEWLEKKMYEGATHIVTVGNGYKKNIVGKDVSGDKVTIITNGADMEIFTPMPPDQELSERYGLDGHFVCAYVGTVGLSSCLEVINQTAAVLKSKKRDDIKMLVVGDGAIKNDLEREAREMGLDNIVYTGLQEKRFMPAFLSVSNACIAHLKKTELFQSVLPSKIFESAAMAKPIILAVEGEAKALVEDAGAGICVEPENPEQLAAAIEKMADDPHLAEELGRAGHEHIAQYYNRDTLAAEYLKLLKRISGV